jgi:putative ABC transport system substrate-binding protein
MRRRDFIAGLGGTAAMPFAARAQDAGRTYRLGMLSANAKEVPQLGAFFDELKRSGFVEGQNLAVEFRRFAAAGDDALKVATELVKSNVEVIVCNGLGAVSRAQAVTRTIPIFGLSDDMVAAGLVQSLARPGGNTTGISILAPELDGKRQDILIEMIPGARRLGVLADATVTTPQQLRTLEAAARVRNIELSIHTVRRADEIAAAIDRAKAADVAALNVLSASLFSIHRKVVIDRITALKLPAIYQWPEMAEEGGLAAYGPRIVQIFRQLARQVVKALNGTRPGDIPVEQPTSFELVINLRTAKTVGLEIPLALMLRADKVIE